MVIKITRTKEYQDVQKTLLSIFSDKLVFKDCLIRESSQSEAIVEVTSYGETLIKIQFRRYKLEYL